MERKLVLIAGGTASGKTKVARELGHIISEKKTSTLIETDHYYLPKKEALAKKENWTEVDYDHPASINWDLLLSDINKLMSGEQVVKNKYDYDKEDYTDEVITFEPSDVVIIEGILTLAVKELVEMADLRIFVHADIDTRYIRRLHRDNKERYRVDNEEFKNRWINVLKPAHNKFIEPTKNFADLIINTETIKEKHVKGVLETLVTLA